MNWDEIKENYPAACNQVYLNTAACGLISKKTAQAQRDHFQQFLNKGGNAYMEWISMVQDTREKAAHLINVSTEDLLFVHNYTAAMNQVAAMWKDKFKDILLLKGDYPSVILPWEVNAYHCHYFEADDNDVISLEVLEDKLKHIKPSILAISHVQFSSGFKIDIRAVSDLCKKYGTYLLLDATQSFGAYAIDIPAQGIDVFVSSVYKWTTAGFGLGICYINPELFEDSHPYLAGNNAVGQAIMSQSDSDITKKKAAFETGHTNFPAMCALNTALTELSEIGIDKIGARIDELVDYLLSSLSDFISNAPIFFFPKENRSGIFSLDVKEEFVSRLIEQDIISSYRNKGLRVSVHFYNDHQDIKTFSSALKKLL